MRKPMIIAGLTTVAVLAVGGAAFANQTPSPSSTTTSFQDQGTTAVPAISREQAEKTALAKVPGGKVTSSELETDDGLQAWEVDIAATDGTEHEISVDAAKGTVLADELDKTDDDTDDDDSDDRDDARDDKDDSDDSEDDD
ncbi:PepSY domain-containing protein [Nonomuraea sp. NPDC046570]|uniref:PepSY domain-containing protein n=1 Tax=Nonomuraea sp. NPDC046570 TaxID=3155255 RepID=UPI0033E3F526